ncbi:MSCRAMM family protein [Streptomyces sp. NPDC003697]
MLLAGDTTTASGRGHQGHRRPGGVTIHKQDPDGDRLAGADFQLTEPGSGRVVAEGTAGADGTLVFDGLEPGVYRLRETDTGSRLHERVPDQDITITEGKRGRQPPHRHRPVQVGGAAGEEDRQGDGQAAARSGHHHQRRHPRHGRFLRPGGWCYWSGWTAWTPVPA